jgi:hypothetical protein
VGSRVVVRNGSHGCGDDGGARSRAQGLVLDLQAGNLLADVFHVLLQLDVAQKRFLQHHLRHTHTRVRLGTRYGLSKLGLVWRT